MAQERSSTKITRPLTLQPLLARNKQETAKLQAELTSAICREMCKPRTPARRLSISVAREVATNLAEQADIRENLERAVIEGHLDAAGLEALQQAEKLPHLLIWPQLLVSCKS